MAFAEDITAFYADFGEPVTVNAVAVTGIFDLVPGDAFGIVNNSKATLRVPSSVAAAVGQSVVRGGTTYTIASVDYADFSGAENLIYLK